MVYSTNLYSPWKRFSCKNKNVFISIYMSEIGVSLAQETLSKCWMNSWAWKLGLGPHTCQLPTLPTQSFHPTQSLFYQSLDLGLRSSRDHPDGWELCHLTGKYVLDITGRVHLSHQIFLYFSTLGVSCAPMSELIYSQSSKRFSFLNKLFSRNLLE